MLDCGGTVTHENDSGALWIQSEHDPLLRLSGKARHCTESWIWEVKALAVKTLWLQEVVRERGPQSTSKGNKADLGTEVLPVATLKTLREACGIGIRGELSKNTVESETDLGTD